MGAAEVDWAHTALAQRRRTEKARALARWCYQHGINGDQIRDMDPPLRRAIARRAGVNPPTESPGGPWGAIQCGETWNVVVRLLAERIVWDADHQQRPPRRAACVLCVVTEPEAASCQHLCPACGTPLHPDLARRGVNTHPTCQPAEAPTPTSAPDAPPPAALFAVGDEDE